MRVQAAKRAIQIQEWATQIKERLESGLTVKKWCDNQGIAQKTYYYRLRRVREELLEKAESNKLLPVANIPSFAPLAAPHRIGGSITVRIGAYSVEIQTGADMASVEHVLQVLSRL